MFANLELQLYSKMRAMVKETKLLQLSFYPGAFACAPSIEEGML